MKNLFFVILIACSALSVKAQKVYTKNGNISFFSKSPLENITATNNQVMSVLNTQTGEMQFSALIKSFHFEKALMQEHFNENYMESSKFPKSTFKGSVSDISKVAMAKDGTYPVVVSGDLTIHGVTKKVSTPGTLTVKNGVISGKSVFSVKLAEYGISIPKLVKDNIAENIEITVNCTYDQKM
jgi:polyisoprenoid-binding protein YceI